MTQLPSQYPPQGPGSPYEQGPSGGTSADRPQAPNLVNGATTYGVTGQRSIRHPWELPLLGVGVVITVIGYVLWVLATAFMIRNWLLGKPAVPSWADSLPDQVVQFYVLMGLIGLVLWIARAILYAQPRAMAVRMSPTQFPEGYRMVAEAAAHHRLRRVPDAYVQLGNGTINAFASGHGFRRFVVVYSDLFEVGGAVRDPAALRFVIGHEVGHIAAGHVSYFRLVFVNLLARIPLLGPAFSRAQEYTADNLGYAFCPEGAPGVMSVLAAGKYLNADVNVNELADRAATEKGLWLHLVNWTASHPIATWRTHALRDRSRAGHLWFRPGFLGRSPGATYDSPLPAGSSFSGDYPTPDEVLGLLDRAAAVRPAGLTNQFGRFPGVGYAGEPSMRQVQTAPPLLAPRIAPATGTGPATPGAGGHGSPNTGQYGSPNTGQYGSPNTGGYGSANTGGYGSPDTGTSGGTGQNPTGYGDPHGYGPPTGPTGPSDRS